MPLCPQCGEENPARARFCLVCGSPLDAPDHHEERKVATVLFADLVGSTELASAQDPERTRALLERFYDAMAAEIESAGGTVEKFAGDAVMAAFGVPQSHEDDAERALHAALSMQRRFAELFGEGLAIRIGVNTGDVVVGRPRERSSFVTGDAVNVAARLEQAAAPGEILAGERTITAARGAFEFGDATKVEAKGKPGGVDCRRVVRPLSLMRPRGVGGLRRAFVGRERELERVREAYRELGDEPRLLTIVGNPGVGKTRLVREAWEWLAGESPEPLRRTGRCLSYGQGITYWPLAEVLKEHLGILESDAPASILRRLEGHEILGLTLGLDAAGGLHPLTARDHLHEAWVELVTDLVAERPLVLLVEDLHWAEPELLDLLERLVRDVNGPLLLLATARPELLDVRPGWGGARRAAATLELEPLSSADSRRMLDTLLAVELPANDRDLIVERAEGNPFFVEELLGTLIDQGVLERAGGGWRMGELPADFDVPDSIQTVLVARIDLLAPAEKAALQAASVIGRVFWTGPVYELLGGLEPDFRILEDRDFIRRRAGSSMVGEREYVIKHALTREVAYGSVPRARRARLHADFAQWIETVGGSRDEHAPLLAYHYATAVRPEDADLAWAGDELEHDRLRSKAVGWLGRAAELAVGRYELREALALLGQALELEPDTSTRIGLLLQVARAQILGYDIEAFQGALEEALALHPDDPVAAGIYSELAEYGLGRLYMWKRPPPTELATRWLESALELAEPGTEAMAQALATRALAAPEDGAQAAQEALAIAEAVGTHDLLLTAIEAKALVASATGRFEEACGWADKTLELLPSVNDPGSYAFRLWPTACIYLRGGRMADVPRLADECERASARLTPHDEVHALALRATLLHATGQWAALADLSDRAEDLIAANGDAPCQYNWRSFFICALGLAHRGEDSRARQLEERALATAVVAGPPEREPALMRLALLRGDLGEAERIFELLPPGGDQFSVDNAAARIDALVALGDRDRVEEEAAPFLGGESYTRPFALRALGIVRGDSTLTEQAAERFEAMGLAWHAEETRVTVRASRRTGRPGS
jgi:class 3 adenylate cyclase/tetratricopeptide (TPR) repeat protein